MAPPENGNEYIDFTQLIALEKLDDDTYRSKALAFGPANGNRTYGGHVYMQACYAAAQTVPKGMMLHVSHSQTQVGYIVGRLANCRRLQSM
jgi:acyl-CoA thioesterase